MSIRYKIAKLENRNYILLMIFSTVLFLIIYGIRTLNPFDVEWVLCNWEKYTHYYNWVAYRHDEWAFPIMGSDAFSYPNYYYLNRDNVLLLELFFKVLSPLLPSDFQYYGLWGLTCFLLQGYFSVKLFEKFLEDDNKVLFASAVYLAIPALMGRMYSCTAMSANWVITILAYLFIGYIRKDLTVATMYKYMALMSAIGIMISPYYSAVIIAFAIGFMVWDEINKNGHSGAIILGESLVIPYLLLLVMGGIGEIKSGLSFVIPQISLYAMPEDKYRVYIGLGDIIVLLYVLYDLYDKNELKNKIRSNWKSILSVSAILIAISSMLVLKTVIGNVIVKNPTAFSFYWTIAESLLIAVFISGIPVVYAIVYFVRKEEKKPLVLLLVMILLLQLDNIQYVIKENHDHERTVPPFYESLEAKNFWDSVAYLDYITTIALTFSNGRNAELIRWAFDNDKKCDNASGERKLSDFSDALMEPDDHTMYVFDGYDDSVDYMQYTALSFYKVDDYVIGYSGDTSGTVTVDPSVLCTRVFKMDDGLINSGMYVSGKKVLFPGGRSYGPFCALNDYNYLVKIHGFNLKGNVAITTYANGGLKIYDNTVFSETYNEIDLAFFVDETANDFELIIDNVSDEEVLLTSYELIPVVKPE